MNASPEQAVRETRAWVDRAVIGLNLCPFAKAVQAKDQVRYVLCNTADPQVLLATLRDELQFLAAANPAVIETTLLIHPGALTDFEDFNQFLGPVDAAVAELGLEGVLQVAAFHPRFQFEGTEPDDVSNATNRAPHPSLHLLREDSISRAVAAFPDPEAIFEVNIRTLEALGPAGWADLQAACRRDAADTGV